MPSANPNSTDLAAREPAAGLRRPRATPPASACPGIPASEASAISPGRCARWARAEGLCAGDTVALLMREPSEIAALRIGLAQVGVRADALDAALGGTELTDRLAACGAGVVIVDTDLAEVYVSLIGHLDTHPAVWWNGADADFARLDRALAEYDDAPVTAAELLRR